MYAIIGYTKEVKRYSVDCFIPEDKEFLIINNDYTIYSSILQGPKRYFPKETAVFHTKAHAERFVQGWQGHPWYIVPNGRYKIVEILPNFEQVLTGYSKIHGEEDRMINLRDDNYCEE